MLKVTRNRSRQNSGFTLLELLLVMAILVVLAGMAGFAVINMNTNALQKAATVQINTFERQCDAFRLNVGYFPAKLDDLHKMPSDGNMTQIKWGGPYCKDPIPMDPWDQPYKYSIDQNNDRVVISSSGPDRQSGTQDDIPQIQ